MISLTFEEKLETAGNLIHDQRVLRIVDSVSSLSVKIIFHRSHCQMI